MRFLALILLLVFITPAQAKTQVMLICKYRARLSHADHHNSKGARLGSAIGVIRQDRANYHRFNKRDVDDQYDPVFGKIAERKKMDALFRAGSGLNKRQAHAILNGYPLIDVYVYTTHMEVSLVQDTPAPPPPKKTVHTHSARPIAIYVARLGPQDHFNSKGRKLTSAIGIIRQDRANYHRFRKRDTEDHTDPVFRDLAKRNLMENMILKAGGISKTLAHKILTSTPVIMVTIYPTMVKVQEYQP